MGLMPATGPVMGAHPPESPQLCDPVVGGRMFAGRIVLPRLYDVVQDALHLQHGNPGCDTFLFGTDVPFAVHNFLDVYPTVPPA